MTDRELIYMSRQHFTVNMIVGDVDVRRVREVGEQLPSDDPFLISVEGIKVGTWRDHAAKLYRRSDLAALFAADA
jgi:hypothetical protein